MPLLPRWLFLGGVRTDHPLCRSCFFGCGEGLDERLRHCKGVDGQLM